MNKIFLGFDFSMISPAVCILKDGRYEFLTFPRGIQKIMKENLELSDVIIHQVTKDKLESKLIADKERYNSMDAEKITATIVSYLNQDLLHDSVVGIEGIAFMARGNSIAQFAGYHYLMRFFLSEFIGYENIYVFTPNSVKKTAGKGNFKKHEMIQAFIDSDDEILQKTEFWKNMKKNPHFFQTKSGNWKKPIDDLVDSYFTLKTVKQSLNGK